MSWHADQNHDSDIGIAPNRSASRSHHKRKSCALVKQGKVRPVRQKSYLGISPGREARLFFAGGRPLVILVGVWHVEKGHDVLPVRALHDPRERFDVFLAGNEAEEVS